MSQNLNKLTNSIFLKKSNAKGAIVNPEEFILDSYREYLISNVVPGTKEAVENLEEKLATIPVNDAKWREEEAGKMLRHIQQLVVTDMLGRQATVSENVAMRKAGRALAAGSKTTERIKRNYGVQVFDEHGNVLTEIDSNGEERLLEKDFVLPQRAHDWANRKLDAAPANSYAVVIWHLNASIISTITRGNAISNLLKTKSGPACRVVGSRSSTVSLVRATAKNTVTHFSRG